MIYVKQIKHIADKGRTDNSLEWNGQKKFLAGTENMNCLSQKQRQSAMDSGNEKIIEQVKLGDKYHAKGKGYEYKEARHHRCVQEKITKFHDDESQLAYDWNCEVIHDPIKYP